MTKFAQENGVKIKPELEKVATHILSKEDQDLQDLEIKINKYVDSKTTTSAPGDWLKDPSINPIRNKHFNFSSKVGTGYNPRFVKGIRTRYEVNA